MEYRQYGSLEEMQADMARAEAEGNSHLAPEQQALTWGSTWTSFDQFGDQNISFGRCFTRTEATSAELDAGASAEEARWVDQRLADALERGYLFGEAASRHYPDPELGSTHRANAWPISRELYDTMATLNYDYNALANPARLEELTPCRQELETAYQAWRRHVLTLQRGQTP